MQIVTTDSIEGKRIVAYKGIVSGDAIVGANFVKDFFAKITDVLGGRAGGYEKALRAAKNHAMNDMIEQAEEVGANAVIGVDLDYESIGGSMLMVSVNGTAVVLEDA
ncbi:YbjQ family protein [Kiloniella sp.]|uniref:YbjQ family protein n=1 Tax=Kiloniella sp. TaxID=1938587 RepID=UPI003A933C9A